MSEEKQPNVAINIKVFEDRTELMAEPDVPTEVIVFWLEKTKLMLLNEGMTQSDAPA